MVSLPGYNDNSPVIEKRCGEAEEDHIAATCFYLDFAGRNEQSPVNMLGSLLRHLVQGSEEVPEAVVQGFRNQKKVIRGLQVPGGLKMFRKTIAARRRTFIYVETL